MTIRIELSPEDAARLRERAERCGETPEALAGEMVRLQLAAPEQSFPNNLLPVVDEAGRFHQARWERVIAAIEAQSVDAPSLPPEALTREALYSDHD